MSTTKTSDPIDMSLVRIPACRVEPDRHYLLRLKGKRRWHRAYLDGNWWVGPFPVFHKKDSGEIRQLPERVQKVIDVVAGRMAEPAPTQEELGIRQYYIERDLLDCCTGLLCWPDNSDEGFSKQQLALFRAVLMAAAALQHPPLPATEVVVGYCLTDEAEKPIFEWPMPDQVFFHAREHKLDRHRLGAIFADGSVKYDHPLAQRPWLKPSLWK